jgi:hypothetical protein
MKKVFHMKIILFLAGMHLCFFLNAQHIDSVLDRLDKDYTQEKLYLQFDRSIYNAGETIWFKAYLFSGINLSLISKTMYAELVDDKGNIIQRITAPVLRSSVAASFEIPTSITGDRIYVRAYTKWMLNFDSSFLYVKALPLITKNAVVNKAVVSTAYLQFFPEGGDLIVGVPSRVAFKATDEHGIPIPVKGSILNASGKKITSFTSIHDGMGLFTITPMGLERYKAVWKDDHGQVRETLLPVAKKEGIVFEVNNTGTQINFTVNRSADTSSAYSEVTVVAQFQHQLIYHAKARVGTGSRISASIPVDSLPAGIAQLTVFDKNERPLAERIVFINQQDYYFITDLNSSVMNTSKREKNVIQIDVPDTLSCNLSVAVTDADLNASGENQDNIFAHVLMTSDIKGYVHNPGYYFSSEADSIIKHLDLVMMTNGWRRFKWEEVLANHWPVLKYQPEDYLSIEGKVYGIDKGLLRTKEVMGILQIKNKGTDILTSKVKDDGSFLFPGLIFYDTAQVYYQFNNDKNKDLTSRASFNIKSSLLNMPMSLQPQEAWMYGYSSKDSIVVKNKQVAERYFTQFTPQKTKVLQTVVIKAKQKSKKQLMDEEYASGLFSGGDDYTFITEDDPFANNSQTVLSYLQGKVAGLQVSLTGSSPSLSWRGGTPSLFLNESPAEVESIQSIPMSDIAMIKVFRPPFIGAFGGGSGGAIAVYYKKGRSRNDAKGLDHVTVTGYTHVKQFYSPDYPADQANSDPDVRTTLYWNPFVLTDKTHRRLFLTFYNNDITKKFRVIIEGFNEQGKLTRIEKVFK